MKTHPSLRLRIFPLLVLLILGLESSASANWPFLNLTAKEMPTHFKTHLWGYFEPTDDFFMKGKILWVDSHGLQIRIIKSDDGKSYEVRFLGECYPASKPWQNYSDEKQWRKIPGRNPEVQMTAPMIDAMTKTLEQHSLGSRKVASVLKNDAGAVDAIWNHWIVTIPAEKRDVIFELFHIYFSKHPGDANVNLSKS